jgi:tetratricopeptide (TPR) repeat protein
MGETAAKALAIDPDLFFARAMYETGNLESYSFLSEIEAFERAAREQPGNPDILRSLSYGLLEAGYLQEALGVAERYVELEPLSPAANFRMADALYAVGRISEVLAALELAHQLGDSFANATIGNVYMGEGQVDTAIARWETWVQEADFGFEYPIREIATGARDPATGQSYLDRRIPQFVETVPDEEGHGWQRRMTRLYLLFGHLDRYFELILGLDLTDSTWTDADDFIYFGTIYRRMGFTAHPKYLEVAESIGIIDAWEQRGPPDFCEKLDGQWICE